MDETIQEQSLFNVSERQQANDQFFAMNSRRRGSNHNRPDINVSLGSLSDVQSENSAQKDKTEHKRYTMQLQNDQEHNVK